MLKDLSAKDHISTNWRGQPLVSLAVSVNLMPRPVVSRARGQNAVP